MDAIRVGSVRDGIGSGRSTACLTNSVAALIRLITFSRLDHFDGTAEYRTRFLRAGSLGPDNRRRNSYAKPRR